MDARGNPAYALALLTNNLDTRAEITRTALLHALDEIGIRLTNLQRTITGKIDAWAKDEKGKA